MEDSIITRPRVEAMLEKAVGDLQVVRKLIKHKTARKCLNRAIQNTEAARDIFRHPLTKDDSNTKEENNG